MANKNLSIFLISRLDVAKSKVQINADIPKLHGQLRHLNIRAKLDPASLNTINSQIKELQGRLATATQVPITGATTGRTAATSTASKSTVPDSSIREQREITRELGKQNVKQEQAVQATQRKSQNVSNVNRALKTQSTQWNKIGKEMTIIESTIIAMRRVPVWMAAMTAFYAPIRSFRQGLEGIRDIDQQLIELSKVSGETQYALEEMRQTALDLGTELGMTADKVLESSVAFARLGYTMRESAEFAREAITFSTVGNMGIEDSTTALISVMKAYDLELGEYEENIRSAIDSVNYCPLC